ncbi:class I SAM-dependent methyltransferase [Cyanobacteria bacterium FACHB-471]|nr:class I SAM-dependent methyltransferase [Cyanobacteria bacterium FACHB-471]
MMQSTRQNRISKPVAANVPASWFGSSTAALLMAFEQQGYSRVDAISAACAQKYGVPEYFAMHRQEREKSNWAATFLEICQEFSVDEQGNRVLVVGVNDGMEVEHFRHCRVVGIDPCREALRLAQSSFPQHEFHVAIAEALPIASASVDRYIALRVVNCSCVDVPAAIAELKRVLKPGGYFVFSIATGFYQGDRFVRGTFKDGCIEPEGATLVLQKLVNTLSAAEMHSVMIENNPTETFVVGRNSAQLEISHDTSK